MLSWTIGAAPPRPRMVSTFLRTASSVSGLTRAPCAPAFMPSTAIASSDLSQTMRMRTPGNFAVDFADEAGAPVFEEGDAEQNHMRLEPADALLIGLFGRGQFVGLDFVMQHELQCRAGDLVVVDHEYAPLIDRF